MPTFDLVREPWVPVLSDGTRVDVSLLDALTMANEWDGLALDEPSQAVGLLRQILLPVVCHAVGLPQTSTEWSRRWSAGVLHRERITAYLSEHADRFDLFHPECPFAQVGGLRTAKGDTKPASLLLPAAATGNNVPLFSARTEGDPPALTPAEAARALLATHCWDTAAIKSGAVGDPMVKAGKTTGNPTGPVGQLGVVIPIGPTLASTILLNTPIAPQGLALNDRPQWIRPPADPAWRQRPAEGLLDLLTWQSRRVRLIPETDEHGSMVVRQVVLAAGDRLDPLPEDEPHTGWRKVDKPTARDLARRPVRHQPGRAAWRGMAALLATMQPTADGVSASRLIVQLADLRAEDHLPADLPLQVLTVGVSYGNQSAVVEDVMADTLPLPMAALSPDGEVRKLLLEVAEQAEQLRQAANRLGDDLRLAAGGAKLPRGKSQRIGDALVHQFTPVVRRMLAGLQRQPERADDADAAWRQTARRLALDAAELALEATPPTAFLGRQESERVARRLSVAEAWYQAAVRRILGPSHLDHLDTALSHAGATP
ncbi:MAG TPA: type I-E CRISPR-associated protein Cse1/CasA [Pseudonocardiaceae bacterium]|nr:type I-E CRISPR-associated protein Cse1/CasA [Pseudonocardiaceae bacterium]